MDLAALDVEVHIGERDLVSEPFGDAAELQEIAFCAVGHRLKRRELEANACRRARHIVISS